MTNKKIDIRDIFKSLQLQMEARLTWNRKILSHTTSKGDASELEWVDMLSTYLPKRYCVEKAFVVDYEGNLSDQIDLVIFDRHFSPFILKQNGATYIPAECVYAVIEVKPTLNMSYLNYASRKAQSVRKLRRTNAKIIQADGKDFEPTGLPKILSGILAIDGKCTTQMENKLKNFAEEKCINFGCSLTGTFFVTKNYEPKKNNAPPHVLTVNNNNSDSLILFFMNLLKMLQKIGSAPAIELDKYIEIIN